MFFGRYQHRRYDISLYRQVNVSYLIYKGHVRSMRPAVYDPKRSFDIGENDLDELQHTKGIMPNNYYASVHEDVCENAGVVDLTVGVKNIRRSLRIRIFPCVG
jgi:hypothetical protein